MSSYYVLALDGGKVHRHEATTLPEAQKLMRKHGPSAAIFTGMKCFGTCPGIQNAARDALIVHARGGGIGDCAFCDAGAVVVVNGDPLCAKHRDANDANDADDTEELEAAPASEPPSAPEPSAAPAPAPGRCLWSKCTQPPSVHPVNDPTLAPYCSRHRGLAAAHGLRPGQTTPLCIRCKKNPRGAQSHRTAPDRRDLCARCRKVEIDRVARTTRTKPAAAPASPPAAPRAVRLSAPAAPDVRSSFEMLLADHELVEIIGRDVCQTLAARLKGGAA